MRDLLSASNVWQDGLVAQRTLWGFVAAMLARSQLENLWVFCGDDERRAVLGRALVPLDVDQTLRHETLLATVATKWMGAFYREVAAGAPVSLAAAAATTREMRKSGLTHPYYWAAMQVSGR